MLLDAVDIPDEMLWTDKYAWAKIRSGTKRTIEGKLHVRESLLPSDSGRPITLESSDAWATRAIVDVLYGMTQELDKSMTLTLNDASTITVKFRHWELPVLTATPIIETAFPTYDTLYIITLKLAVI